MCDMKQQQRRRGSPAWTPAARRCENAHADACGAGSKPTPAAASKQHPAPACPHSSCSQPAAAAAWRRRIIARERLCAQRFASRAHSGLPRGHEQYVHARGCTSRYLPARRRQPPNSYPPKTQPPTGSAQQMAARAVGRNGLAAAEAASAKQKRLPACCCTTQQSARGPGTTDRSRMLAPTLAVHSNAAGTAITGRYHGALHAPCQPDGITTRPAPRPRRSEVAVHSTKSAHAATRQAGRQSSNTNKSARALDAARRQSSKRRNSLPQPLTQ